MERKWGEHMRNQEILKGNRKEKKGEEGKWKRKKEEIRNEKQTIHKNHKVKQRKRKQSKGS